MSANWPQPHSCNLSIDPERSILLAMQAVSTTRAVDGTVLPEAEEALHRSILASHVALTLDGHTTPLIGVVYTPDGKRLATIGKDGTVKVWDATTGLELLNLPGTTPLADSYGPQRLAISPDGALLASSDNNQVKIRDSVSGTELRTLSGHTAEVWAVVSRDGTGFTATRYKGSGLAGRHGRAAADAVRPYRRHRVVGVQPRWDPPGFGQ
jgi:DNA-binding beta-propeller fold protein YncE